MATSIYHSSMTLYHATLRCRAIHCRYHPQQQWVAGFAQGYIFQKQTALPKQEVAAWGVDGRSSPTQHAWWRTAAKLHTHHIFDMFPQGRAFFLKNEAWFGFTKQLSLGTEIKYPETKQKKLSSNTEIWWISSWIYSIIDFSTSPLGRTFRYAEAPAYGVPLAEVPWRSGRW